MSTTSSKVWTTDPGTPVPLRIGETGIAAELPTTIGKLFQQTVEKFPDNPALAFKEGETLRKTLYKEYYNLSIKAAKSLIKVLHVLAYVYMCCLHKRAQLQLILILDVKSKPYDLGASWWS